MLSAQPQSIIISLFSDVAADAPRPALPRQFPPDAAVAGVVHHASHYHPPHGDPRGGAQHQSEPGQLHQGIKSAFMH